MAGGRRLLAVPALLAVAVVAVPASAQAPIETSPANGAVVGGSVDEIHLLFAQEMATDDSFVVVTDPRGAAVPSAGGLALDDAGRRLTAPIRALSVPGEYRVDYRVVVATGGEVAGSFEFAFDPEAASPAPIAPLEQETTGGATPWAVIAGAIVVGALLLWRLGRRAWRRW